MVLGVPEGSGSGNQASADLPLPRLPTIPTSDLTLQPPILAPAEFRQCPAILGQDRIFPRSRARSGNENDGAPEAGTN